MVITQFKAHCPFEIGDEIKSRRPTPVHHIGSGSSRIAAYEAGLDFIGFEIDPVMFAAEEQRFADHTAQQSLFHAKRLVINGG